LSDSALEPGAGAGAQGDTPSELYLGIDTATPFLALALCTPLVGSLASTVEHVGRGHAARLIGALEELLATANADRSRITAIAAGNGPGSYTGLRVGGAAAAGLARALRIPLAGCDTLAAVAFRALADGEEGLAALDARRGNVYVGRYRREGTEITTLDAPSRRAREEVLAEFPDHRLVENEPPDPVYIAGRAASGAPFRPIYL
jgi:tRNA threonylcarbamoyladenosine biosynthesis protein TsaB